jgi:predicted DCC family thiol-disulfide oxidoreductase YuxK
MQQPIVLFDGVCNLCNPLVNFILKKENGQHILFVSLQSDLAKKIFKQYSIPYEENNFETILFIENNNVWQKSEALFKIASLLKKPFSALVVFKFLPRRLNDALYNLISNNRYKILGKSETCYVPIKSQSHRFPVDL